MLALLLGIAVGWLDHETPRERIEYEDTIEKYDVVSFNKSLERGKIYLLNIRHVGMVLGVSASGEYAVYIGRIPAEGNERTSEEWYQVDSSDEEGFICIGNSYAIVEIVALDDITLSVAGAFLGEKGSREQQCTTIYAGSDESYIMNNQLLSSSESRCILTTHVDAWPRVSADLRNGVTLSIYHDGEEIRLTELAISNDKFPNTQVMALRSANDAYVTMSIEYLGGDAFHSYTSKSRLSYKSHLNYFGIYNNKFTSFRILLEEPEYPDEDDLGTILMATLFPIFALALWVGLCYICIKRANKKSTSSDGGANQTPTAQQTTQQDTVVVAKGPAAHLQMYPNQPMAVEYAQPQAEEFPSVAPAAMGHGYPAPRYQGAPYPVAGGNPAFPPGQAGFPAPPPGYPGVAAMGFPPPPPGYPAPSPYLEAYPAPYGQAQPAPGPQAF